MDTHDVSCSDQYANLLKMQKESLKAATARNGECPTDRPASRDLVHKFITQVTIQRMNQLTTTNELFIHSSFVPPSYPPSTTPLKELKQTFIKELRLGTHHRGTYLLVRSITPPNKMTAILAIVEDEMKDVVVLQLYQHDDHNDRPATSVVNQNDVFLVKEPFFKVMADGEYGLRVDHVSDLIRVQTQDEMLPKQWRSRILEMDKTAADWRTEGNAAMGRQQYWAAIRRYTTALGCTLSVKEEGMVRLNRALAYLRDERFDAALKDTEYLNSQSDAPEKALYRAGQAFYKLGRFSECQDVLARLCEKYPGNVDATNELTRVRCRLHEQQSGIYDFKVIYDGASHSRPPHLDHATFVGPVAIKVSTGRGRGLFTTTAVKAGELLLCEKAFAHCCADTGKENPENMAKISLLINTDTNRMTMGTQSDLITTIVQKLWRNPSLMSEFAALYHGSYDPVNATEVDGEPIIDTFLIERTISLNVFGCPLTSRESHSKDTDANKNQHHSCGIWLMASSINHSCLSNVRRSFIGDLQLIHATRDIPADTELTFWYCIPTDGNFEETQKALQGWGFECNCAICLDSKSAPKKLLKRRHALLQDLENMTSQVNEVDAAKFERLLASVSKTYKSPASHVPRVALWRPYLALTRLYAAEKNPVKAVALTLKTLESLGFVIEGAHIATLSSNTFQVQQWGLMTDGVIEAWIHLCNAYAIFAPHLFQKARDCAKISYKICVGEDMTFDESYGKNASL